jgi:glycosyltransferase involved in cell wall biosynthesis
MACGCPVICSARGSLGEVVGSAAKIVDPENINAMKEALATVSSDSALREKMKAQGLMQAQLFNWNKAAETTLKVYERAAKKFNPTIQIARFHDHHQEHESLAVK